MEKEIKSTLNLEKEPTEKIDYRKINESNFMKFLQLLIKHGDVYVSGDAIKEMDEFLEK